MGRHRQSRTGCPGKIIHPPPTLTPARPAARACTSPGPRQLTVCAEAGHRVVRGLEPVPEPDISLPHPPRGDCGPSPLGRDRSVIIQGEGSGGGGEDIACRLHSRSLDPTRWGWRTTSPSPARPVARAHEEGVERELRPKMSKRGTVCMRATQGRWCGLDSARKVVASGLAQTRTPCGASRTKQGSARRGRPGWRVRGHGERQHEHIPDPK